MAGQSAGVRTRTRALLVQALYQAQLTGHELDEVHEQFRNRQEFAKTDSEMFGKILSEVFANKGAIDAMIVQFADRPVDQIDPVERAVLSVGLQELSAHPDTPYRVVINEAVNLARRFGAEDGHKYVNAILDKAAAVCRPDDYAG